MDTNISFYRPQLATREVSLKDKGGRRCFLFSSEVLPMFGFESGQRITREALPGVQGFNLIPDVAGAQHVYSRRYSRRNRRETQIEVSGTEFLSAALPAWTERIHITLRQGRIEARPVPNHTFSIRKSFKEALDPYTAFMALSAGVDGHCLSSLGFTIAGHLEWRPPEARDIASGRDLTESGILTALANTEPSAVFNEDIRTVDWTRVRDLMDMRQPVAVFHCSLQCDDFSALKNAAARSASMTDLTSTRDLYYDALRAIETIRPVTVLIENVTAFATSPEAEVFMLRLRRWGYNVSVQVVDPTEFGSLTTRKRCYIVASLFPGFEFPTATGRNTTPIMGLMADELPNCRDVTHCKAVHDGIAVGRDRHISADSLVAPTITKSQARQTKDSVYFAMPDGRFLLPSRRVLQRLCEIPDSFSTAHHGEELASETIGQSVSYRMHHAIMANLKSHLAACHSGSAGIVVSQAKHTLCPASRAAEHSPEPSQMELL